jgi:hypothetical protein
MKVEQDTEERHMTHRSHTAGRVGRLMTRVTHVIFPRRGGGWGGHPQLKSYGAHAYNYFPQEYLKLEKAEMFHLSHLLRVIVAGVQYLILRQGLCVENEEGMRS